MLLIWNNQCKHLRYKMCCKNATVSSLERGPCVWGGRVQYSPLFPRLRWHLKKNKKWKTRIVFVWKFYFSFLNTLKPQCFRCYTSVQTGLNKKLNVLNYKSFLCKIFGEKNRKKKQKKQTWHTHFMKKKNNVSCNGRQDVKSHLTPQNFFVHWIIFRNEKKKKICNKPVHPNTIGI